MEIEKSGNKQIEMEKNMSAKFGSMKKVRKESMKDGQEDLKEGDEGEHKEDNKEDTKKDPQVESQENPEEEKKEEKNKEETIGEENKEESKEEENKEINLVERQPSDSELESSEDDMNYSMKQSSHTNSKEDNVSVGDLSPARESLSPTKLSSLGLKGLVEKYLDLPDEYKYKDFWEDHKVHINLASLFKILLDISKLD